MTALGVVASGGGGLSGRRGELWARPPPTRLKRHELHSEVTRARSLSKEGRALLAASQSAEWGGGGAMPRGTRGRTRSVAVEAAPPPPPPPPRLLLLPRGIGAGHGPPRMAPTSPSSPSSPIS